MVDALALVMLIMALCVTAPAASDGPVWVDVELVENTAEGPAFNRCQVEAALETGQTTRWRVFYGEAGADSGSGWAAIRSRSGCAQVSSGSAAVAWTMRGSPYLVADVVLGQASIADSGVRIEASFSVQTLTGFVKAGAPTYQKRTEKRTLRIPEGGVAVVPILIAGQKETEGFRVRELLLKFRAGAAGSRPPAEHGEIAVAADVPRAQIFLDGGFVGRTSYDGSVVVSAVRAGEREVVVRDASGREARAVTRVEKGSRNRVALVLLKDAPVSAEGLRPLGRNSHGGEEFWRVRDAAIVVRIPGGDFQMGSPEGEGERDEHPQHAVHLRDFLLDKTEVTWGQYRMFLSESQGRLPKSPLWGMPEALPVSSITWQDAVAYCAWAGGRLPTEAEWERAARGDDGRQYPWGNNWDPKPCNTRDGGPHGPTPAGANLDCVGPYGILDQVGSVAEWVSDWYGADYYASSPAENPKGPATGAKRVARGGGWMIPSLAARSSSRLGIEPIWPNPTGGFRCAMDDRTEADK